MCRKRLCFVLKHQPVPTDKGRAAFRGSAFSSILPNLCRSVARPYQGISFFNPFFLLLDSFLLEFASAAAGAVVFVASVAGASAAGASVLAVSVVVAAPGVAVSVEFAALPSVLAVPELSLAPEVVSSALAGFGSPGLTVSTTAGEFDEPPPLPDTRVVRFPPLNVSVPPLSASGSICGLPAVAVMCTSGPLRIMPIARWTGVSFGLGAFCSAVIHASAFGSGCGIGTPYDFNLSCACGAFFDNG